MATRIMILLGGRVFSGAEITTLRFADHLPDDFTVTVCAAPSTADKLGDRYVVKNWPNESAPGDDLLRASHFLDEHEQENKFCSAARAALTNLIRQERPDVVLACMFPVSMLALPVLRQMQVPLVVHHQLMYSDIPDHAVVKPITEVASYASEIIAASEASAQPLLESGVSNVSVVHAGIPADYGLNRTVQRKFRGEVVAVGTWGPVKGLDTLIEASGELVSRNVKFHLTVVGPLDAYSSEYAQNIESAAKKLVEDGTVKFAGSHPDVREFYREADIAVVPSSSPDPFPTVTLEAMAHALPVVGTRCGGIVEQIEDGITGVLVDPCNSTGLADGLERLLMDNDLVEKMGLAGLAKVRREFSLERQADALSGILARASV